MGPTIFAKGDFSFVDDKLMREMLTYDFNAINKIGEKAWDALMNHNSDMSFMYHTRGTIWDEIRDNLYPGHSGASYGVSMRIFEKIAKYGWENFVSDNT